MNLWFFKGGGNRFGVWRPVGYFCRRPASFENFSRRLASVLIVAFGVFKPHFLASSVHRATFAGVSRPSFFRVRQLNELSFFVIDLQVNWGVFDCEFTKSLIIRDFDDVLKNPFRYVHLFLLHTLS